ncbi:hypothetical protein, partial [Nocardioides sp.]|uniref:divisome protein SepX/GlpR n=1 Tax=Nocardioides sp. TaxID=35761 RepID=UPI0039E67683
MDPSSLIFVAVFLAWAIYGIQKALEHHEAGSVSRTVDRFSHTLRVLARREPVSGRKTRLVKPGETRQAAKKTVVKPTPEPVSAEQAPRPQQPRPVRRSAAAVAARRRRIVLLAILVAGLAVVAVAATHRIGWWWVAAPVAVLIAWLVACRLMVKRERAARRRPVAARPTVAPPARQPV